MWLKVIYKLLEPYIVSDSVWKMVIPQIWKSSLSLFTCLLIVCHDNKDDITHSNSNKQSSLTGILITKITVRLLWRLSLIWTILLSSHSFSFLLPSHSYSGTRDWTLSPLYHGVECLYTLCPHSGLRYCRSLPINLRFFRFTIDIYLTFVFLTTVPSFIWITPSHTLHLTLVFSRTQFQDLP